MKRRIDIARKNKNDEFYTLYKDIENELIHYDKSQFKDKVVYCNCDDYRVSNFYKYFKTNFKALGLKLLLSSGYKPTENGVFSRFDGVKEESGTLNSNGSYDSSECLKMLDEADIVVTNPPFSLLKVFIPFLLEKEKHILVLCTLNTLSYKDIFKYIFYNKLWTGVNKNTMEFLMSRKQDFVNPKNSKTDEEGNKYVKIPNARWLTNMKHTFNHNEKLVLTKEYDEKGYQRYDNYDAINVNKLKDIPINYNGVMGVPISILDYIQEDGYIHINSNGNNEKCQIIKYRKGNDGKDLKTKDIYPYPRLLIKKKFKVIGIFNNFKINEEYTITGKETDLSCTLARDRHWVGPVINNRAIYSRIIIKED